MFHPVGPKALSPSDIPRQNQSAGPAGAVSSSENGGGGVQNAQGKPMIQLSGGSGSNCLACVGAQSGMIPQDKLEELKAKMYDKIMAHEQAHASAAGAFGGAIHIDYDANGIAVGGHVPINIPGLNKMNPEESLKAFETIYNAAVAPGDPSSQDMSVASQAQDLMGRAKVMMDQKQQREAKTAGASPTTPQPGQMGQSSQQQKRAPQNPFAVAV